MLKQSLFIVVLSILAMFFIKEVGMVLGWLASGHAYLSKELSQVFAGGKVGQLVREVIILIVIPAIVGLVPAAVYWIVKRKAMPHIVCIIWFVWVVLVTILATH